MTTDSLRIESEFELRVARSGADECRILTDDLDLTLSYDCLLEMAIRLSEVLAEIDRDDVMMSSVTERPNLQLVAPAKK